MTDVKPDFPVTREAVATFATRSQFRDAVGRLLAAGFAPSDLSVLATHDSLEVAGGVPGYPGQPRENFFAGLTDEAPILMPLAIAGMVLVSGGEIAALLAALATAGLGGVAMKEILDRFTANRHSAEFAEALKAGAVLLWVRADDADLELSATRILAEAGGSNVHVHGRQGQA